MMVAEWAKRAEQKTAYDQTTGCWLYQGEKVHNGYGRIYHKGKNVRVHRLSYSSFIGEIPSGIMVCHSCDVRNCWNPGHLFLGTAKENHADMWAKGRATLPPRIENKRGEDHPWSKLTTSDVIRIRELCASGQSQRSVGKLFGVRQGVVSSILRGKSWTHI